MILFCFVLLSKCGHPVEKVDIAKLNGYWEIECVVLKSGEKKDYPMNETYDYFEVKDNMGKRTKVMPQLDGKFLTNGISEDIKIVTDKDKTYIDYQTFYTKWREELISVDDQKLVTRNAEENEFYYKRTGPVNLKTDEKKTP